LRCLDYQAPTELLAKLAGHNTKAGVVGVSVVGKEVLSQRTADYQAWVEAFARNHRLPIEWAEKGGRKKDHVVPWQRRMARKRVHGVDNIFKSMEQGPTFRVSVPKYPTKSLPPRRRGTRITGSSPPSQPLHALLFLYSRRNTIFATKLWARW
jgi:hypothetical protein